MKRSMKFRTIYLPAIFTLLLLPCAAAIAAALADQGDPNAGKVEILTSLEQRMQKKISVDFRDTTIDDVIRIMAEQADVDVIKSPKVTGTVTAKLKDVPLEEALRNILAAHGYDYVMSKNMIRVAPSSEITQEAEKLDTKVYRIYYADVKEVEKSLGKFVSQRGAISTNPGTSNIIVKDTESNIKAIDTFIDDIDRITPQILVEARIYDITSRNGLDLGVEWMAGRNTSYTSDAAGTAALPPGALGANPSGVIDPFATSMFTGATGKTKGTSGLLKFGWLTGNIDIDMVIRAQQNLINAKLLANPRILVLDNETAQIRIIQELPYQEMTQTSGGGNIGSTNFKDVGVTLKVTPHLTRGEKIRLKVEPEFSVKTDEVTFATGNLTYPQPVVDTRKAMTTLLVDSGKTVVLGGLRKKDVTKQVNKVPLLGDIPLIGLLFRFEGEDTINSEMVVFITPWIINEARLSDVERKQYEVTDFPSPELVSTKAEKNAAADEK
jgi:type IV pilus assembly protein PilQ